MRSDPVGSVRDRRFYENAITKLPHQILLMSISVFTMRTF